MDTAGARSRQADAELARVFGISAGHECRRFLVTRLNKPDLLLPLAQRLHDAVDAIPRQAKNDIDSPIVNGFDKNIGSGGHDPSIETPRIWRMATVSLSEAKYYA